MKILNIHDTYRTYLEKKKALGIDLNNDEVLVGLTRSESIEYIELTNGSISTPLPTDFSEPLKFLEMYERHQAALPKEIVPYYLKGDRYIPS